MRLLIFILVLTLLCAFQLYSLTGHSKETSKFVVVIDPGHGGEDEGASIPHLKEKHLSLQVGLELRKLLQENPKVKVIMTREKDEFVALDQRRELAEKSKADIFVSIHANSSPSQKIKGVEFYFENQLASDEESQMLANRENTSSDGAVKTQSNEKGEVGLIINDLQRSQHMVLSEKLSASLMENFHRHTGTQKTRIRQAPFRVLKVDMPATLVELGYLTNKQEAQWMGRPENHRKMAQALYSGLKEFFPILMKGRNNP
ncbi:MAG: N-acetylmuramoyl-L-alanine amidase [Oligoflexia bacterium]|nr:N-acetylmuramoyl-L-alanine amidase [Oligoflexia bacterium]